MDSAHTARRVIGSKYAVSSKIPTHGSSRLYKAVQADTGRNVVVREFRPADLAPAEALSILARMAAISSRFLVDLLDVAQIDSGEIYVAHQYLDGESLIQRLGRKNKLSAPEAAALCTRILKGLDSLHRRDLFHGALRPSRVFHEKTKGRGWHVKLLSACVRNLTVEEMREAPEVVRYAPVEWLRDRKLDARSDVWAVGLILHECLTGKPAFDGPSGAEVEQQVLAGHYLPLRKIEPDAPSDLEEVVRTALQPNPDDRFANAAQMLDRILSLYPETERKHSGHTQAEHWTRGGFVGKVGAPLELPPALERTQSTQMRRERKAVRSATTTAIAVTAACAVILFGALYLRIQKERAQERALLEQLASQRAQQPPAAPVVAPTPPAPVVTPPPAPAPVVAAAPAAIASDAGAAQTTQPAQTQAAAAQHASTHTHHTTASNAAEPEPAQPAQPAANTAGGAADGPARIDFRAAEECDLIIDGSRRGVVSSTNTPVSPGSHQVSCRPEGSNTIRVTVHAQPGRTTHVRVNRDHEVDVYSD